MAYRKYYYNNNYSDTYEFERNQVVKFNKELQEKINDIEKIPQRIQLFSFSKDDYYKKMMRPVTIENYKPITPPKENDIKKKVGIKKENWLLDKIIDGRQEKVAADKQRFEEAWKKATDEYNIQEENNREKYNEYLKEKKKEYYSINKDIINRKECFDANNDEEISNIINDYINAIHREQKENYYWKVNSLYNKRELNLDIKFINPDKELESIKEYYFEKSSHSIKAKHYNFYEKESWYEKIVFNYMLLYLFKIGYYLRELIDSIVINAYVEDINQATGNYEKFFFFSCKVLIDDIPFNNVELLDARKFFDNHHPRYKLPFIKLNKIEPYNSIDNNEFDNKIELLDGFEFEKYSKALLERNGYTNVKVTKASGDYGADVIAVKDGVKYAIQCKKYSSYVGVTAVQEVIASKSVYNCHVAVVFTNSSFTPNAIELAEKNNVLLWDKHKLDEMISFAKHHK